MQQIIQFRLNAKECQDALMEYVKNTTGVVSDKAELLQCNVTEAFLEIKNS